MHPATDAIAARAAAFGRIDATHDRPIHRQNRMVKLRNLLRGPINVVPDKRPPRTVRRPIRPRPMDQVPPEKQRLPPPHRHRHRLKITRERANVAVAVVIPPLRISLRTKNVAAMRTRRDVEAAVFHLRVIDRSPRRDTGRRMRPQVKVVLVHPLPLCSGRLKVIHRLRRERGPTKKGFEDRAHAGMQKPRPRLLAETVRMHRPQLPLLRIDLGVTRAPVENFVPPQLIRLKEGLHRRKFGFGIKPVHETVTIALEPRPLSRIQKISRSRGCGNHRSKLTHTPVAAKRESPQNVRLPAPPIPSPNRPNPKKSKKNTPRAQPSRFRGIAPSSL